MAKSNHLKSLKDTCVYTKCKSLCNIRQKLKQLFIWLTSLQSIREYKTNHLRFNMAMEMRDWEKAMQKHFQNTVSN